MTRSKVEGQREHAAVRSLERYGVWLDRSHQREIILQIQSGRDATFLERRSNRVSIWQVIYHGRPMRVVYDKKRHSLATVLPVAD